MTADHHTASMIVGCLAPAAVLLLAARSVVRHAARADASEVSDFLARLDVTRARHGLIGDEEYATRAEQLTDELQRYLDSRGTDRVE